MGGPYTITYTTPGPLCPNSSTFDVTINPEDNPAFSYSAAAFCQGDVNPGPTVTGTGGGTYTAAPGIIFTDGSPSASGTIDLAASTVGGPYTITYTTPGPLCPNSSTFDVTINPEDDPAFNYSSLVYCESDGLITPENVANTNGVFSSGADLYFINNMSGEISLDSSIVGGPYSILYTTLGVCPNSSIQTLEIFGLPIADAGPDQSLDYIYDTDMNAVLSVYGQGEWYRISGTGTIWNGNDPLSHLNELSLGSNVFVWEVRNSPCPSSQDTVVIVVNDLFIPEAITPNNDGKNDQFVIKGIENTTNTIQIYNRWGQLVFETLNYQNNWSGKNMNNELLPNDTYFYIIVVNDDLKFNGYVVIKR